MHRQSSPFRADPRIADIFAPDLACTTNQTKSYQDRRRERNAFPLFAEWRSVNQAGEIHARGNRYAKVISDVRLVCASCIPISFLVSIDFSETDKRSQNLFRAYPFSLYFIRRSCWFCSSYCVVFTQWEWGGQKWNRCVKTTKQDLFANKFTDLFSVSEKSLVSLPFFPPRFCLSLFALDLLFFYYSVLCLCFPFLSQSRPAWWLAMHLGQDSLIQQEQQPSSLLDSMQVWQTHDFDRKERENG